MKWITNRTPKAKKIKFEKWHKYFAWFPVAVDEYSDGTKKKVWLEDVMRRGEYHSYGGDVWWSFEYKEITNNVSV